MTSRRPLVPAILVALLLTACATSTDVPADPSSSASSNSSSTPSPFPSSSPAPGPQPSAEPGSPIALTPLTPAADVTNAELQALLPVASDMPSGWVPAFVDHAAIPYAPTFEPCGPVSWYVLGHPMESDVPFAETRWASSGDVSAPPLPTSITTTVRATPDAAAAFERIATDLAACPDAGASDPDLVAAPWPAPSEVPDAVCGELVPVAGAEREAWRSTFCVATAGDRIVVVHHLQAAPPQVVLDDAQIDAAFGAAIARVLG